MVILWSSSFCRRLAPLHRLLIVFGRLVAESPLVFVAVVVRSPARLPVISPPPPPPPPPRLPVASPHPLPILSFALVLLVLLIYLLFSSSPSLSATTRDPPCEQWLMGLGGCWVILVVVPPGVDAPPVVLSWCPPLVVLVLGCCHGCGPRCLVVSSSWSWSCPPGPPCRCLVVVVLPWFSLPLSPLLLLSHPGAGRPVVIVTSTLDRTIRAEAHSGGLGGCLFSHGPR